MGISQSNLYWEECSKLFSDFETIAQEVKELEIAIAEKKNVIKTLNNKKKKLSSQLKVLKIQMDENLGKLNQLLMIHYKNNVAFRENLVAGSF